MSFLDDTGAWIGFDVDLATAMASQLGYDLELIQVDETTRISFLQNNRVDMSIASMNHTRSRDEAIDFSITYLWDNQSFLVRTGSYTSIDGLVGQLWQPMQVAPPSTHGMPMWLTWGVTRSCSEPRSTVC